MNKNGGTRGSIKSQQGVLNHGSKGNSSTNNKSRPKYLECWGDADKPFANITENNATAKSTTMMVSLSYNKLFIFFIIIPMIITIVYGSILPQFSLYRKITCE
jgi:hypothetical protein